MRVTIRPYKNIDGFTVVLYGLLVAFGWINIYAANYTPDNATILDISTEHTKQLIWIGLSLVIVGILFLIDSKFFVEFAYIFFGISILLLILSLFFGVEINGAKAWFQIGAIRFQPAELTKVTASIALARVMSRYNFRMSKPRYVFKMSSVLFLPFIIILLQNDTGSALVYLAFFLVFFREGMPPAVLLLGALAVVVLILSLLYDTFYIISGLFLLLAAFIYFKKQRKIALTSIAVAGFFFILAYGSFFIFNQDPGLLISFLVGAIAASVYILLQSVLKKQSHLALAVLLLWGMMGYTYSTHYFFDNVLSDYQRNRVLVMLGLQDDPLGVGYNVNQSKIAIGSGGFYGKGFLEGTQTKYDFVPEQSTDFIFCTVGEEWGFIGTSMVIAIFLLLLLRIIVLAERQHSAFSRIYGYCVVAIFFIHLTINIGMTIGLAPVIGIPLPFFSYGGSSLWGFTMLLFIFLKLDTNRAELIR
jgi:rod shape determining protein RodA